MYSDNQGYLVTKSCMYIVTSGGQHGKPTINEPIAEES